MNDKTLSSLLFCALIAAASGCDGGPQEGTTTGGTTTTESAPACAPGEAESPDGTCVQAGIPPGACAEGFTPDGQAGCTPVLPPDPCSPGQLALPGDTACHEIAPCGEGPWGDIPTEPTTQFVDAAFPGDDSDGTPQKPWKTIQKAIFKAAPGAIVAVASGVYPEDVRIQGKPVRLWGRCPGGPSRVEVVGQSGGNLAAVEVLNASASGSTVRGISVTGEGIGIGVTGATGVRIEQVWVHDTTEAAGIDIEDANGPTSVAVVSSLVESASVFGVFVAGAEVTLESTAVRATALTPFYLSGTGIMLTANAANDHPSTGTLRRVLLDGNHNIGLLVNGSDATLETSVVRNTLPFKDGSFGRGVHIQDDLVTAQPATAEIRTSVIADNRDLGIFLHGAQATIESTVVRGTLPDAQGAHGRGIQVQADLDSGARSSLLLRTSLIDGSHDFGVAVASSDLTVESTVVRGTLPGTDGSAGDGIAVFTTTPDPSTATITGSRVESNARAGVSFFSAAVTLTSSAVVCNALDLDGEVTIEGQPNTFTDGGNLCGCEVQSSTCVVWSAGLSPPSQIPPH
ncbi:MAG: right-handed parallel beta-helix repeat-containing protein [Polyangiaceae bacterium]